MTVTGPGPVVLLNGSSGRYAFQVTVAGTYTLAVTPPPGYQFSETCLRQDPPPLNPPNPLPNVLSLGNPENGNTGFLTSNVCTMFYLSFNLVPTPGDPVIINNNIPLRRGGTATNGDTALPALGAARWGDRRRLRRWASGPSPVAQARLATAHSGERGLNVQ